ncbi:putative cytochrome oxidase assembly protein [Austwickia chelonae NBRC 105200]|uniref:Putative cytochrome oxidase assembly protein n=1 Tax=Austwickia chelonae NBRC 105200 TaxID=1184607 RepID=K6ULF2_9MICO|nr:COX15/CtaA family protein [Austwickia chelonae]GAB77196.1 putative cytochrome oxidase assembly protein [Austwickia chelonae NBRC 105200]
MTSDVSPARQTDPFRLRAALIANLVLQGTIIVSGGLVRLTGSGLGCPTWPECTPGSFTPVAKQAEGWHVYVEFGNRLMTFVLTAAAVWVVVAAHRHGRAVGGPESRRFRTWAWVPLAGIFGQAVVGGVIVLTKLDPRTVSPHFLLSVALVAYSAWLLAYYDKGCHPSRAVTSTLMRRLVVVVVSSFVLVVVLGTAVTGSGPHSGDAVENVRFGFDPLLTSRLHALSVWVFTAGALALVLISRRESRDSDRPGECPQEVPRWWTLTLLLVLCEGAVGYLQYFTGLPVVLVAFHMGLSAVLTAVVTFAVMAGRAPAAESVAVEVCDQSRARSV